MNAYNLMRDSNPVCDKGHGRVVMNITRLSALLDALPRPPKLAEFAGMAFS
jgi:hypothetical protein